MLSLLISNISGIKITNLDGDQWQAAALLIDALRLFLDITTIISAARYPTV